jgi:hypothetical protein
VVVLEPRERVFLVSVYVRGLYLELDATGPRPTARYVLGKLAHPVRMGLG